MRFKGWAAWLLMFPAIQATAGAPEGNRIKAGSQCYQLTEDGKPVGIELEKIEQGDAEGRAAWIVTQNRRLTAGGVDEIDRLALDRSTLLPIDLDEQRGLPGKTPDWQKLTLHYTPTQVTGTRETDRGKTDIAIAFKAGPVWEAHVSGLLIAALPLHQMAQFSLPVWSYEQGFASYSLLVTGSVPVRNLQGSTDAWSVRMNDDHGHGATYLVGKNPVVPMGFSGNSLGQMPGGDCRVLE